MKFVVLLATAAAALKQPRATKALAVRGGQIPALPSILSKEQYIKFQAATYVAPRGIRNATPRLMLVATTRRRARRRSGSDRLRDASEVTAPPPRLRSSPRRVGGHDAAAATPAGSASTASRCS